MTSRFTSAFFVCLLVLLLLLWAIARAQPVPMPDAKLTALGQMLQEAQQREAMALIRAITAEQRANMLDEKLKTATNVEEKPKDTAP